MPIIASSCADRIWRDAVVVARGDQVRADQAVGARAADEEGARPGSRRPATASRGRAPRAARARAARPRRRRRPSGRSGSSPRSSGRSRMNTSTIDEHDRRRRRRRRARRRASRAARPAPASSGRNTSCPVAFAAESAPSTRPRRSSNHRVATTAASTIDVTPVPVPTSTPHSSVSCHWLRICVVSATDDGKQRERGEHDAAHAPSIHHRRGERTDQPEQRDVDRDGGRDHRPVPAELALERHHQDAGRRADAGGDQQDDEGDRGDDPGVVETVAGGDDAGVHGRVRCVSSHYITR